jgi:4-hydroxythreonine-4-phosphate dehydrogenase
MFVITAGEPAGIGPDLVVELAQSTKKYPCVIIADPNVIQQRAKHHGIKLKIINFDVQEKVDPVTAYTGQGQLLCLPIKVKVPVFPGKLSAENSDYVLESIKIATQLCMDGICDALVTGPIHKGIINTAIEQQLLALNPISHFSGHTEYLADLSHTQKVIMMLATEGLRVALVTTHLPLKDISNAITTKLLTEIITLLNSELKSKFSITEPKIAICGLNPHAGEEGHMGSEEVDTIIPVIEKLKSQGMHLDGPIPADTIFAGKYMQNADTILAMYHDQGLPVLKYKGFGNAVNITLGLPFIRTSVDHGTALELAGGEDINSGSMFYAIKTAETMVNKRLWLIKDNG